MAKSSQLKGDAWPPVGRRIPPYPRSCCIICLLFIANVAESLASTVSPMFVSLSDLSKSAGLIVTGQVTSVEAAADNATGMELLNVRVEEILKGDRATTDHLRGSTIRLYDPREKFRLDHKKMIDANVISYIERSYPTKANRRVGDLLIFFIGTDATANRLNTGDTYALTAGNAYEAIGAKRAVLKFLKRASR